MGRLRRIIWGLGDRVRRSARALAAGAGDVGDVAAGLRRDGGRRCARGERRHRAAAQSNGKCGRIRKAIVWILLETHHHGARDVLRQIRPALIDRNGLLRQVLHQHRWSVARHEWGLAAEHLVADDAKRVEIAAAVDGAVASGLLGRHVSGGPDGHARCGETRVAAIGKGARDTEVRHHRASGLVVDDDVVWLDVAVNDVAVVRVSEGFGDFAQNTANFDGRHRPVLLQALAEVVALDVRHHEVDEVVFFFDGVDRYDVLVIELRRGLCFAQETLTNISAEAQLRRQNLDRDLALESAISRAIHDSHTATTDFAL